jgi:hypothetical protein
VKSSACAEMFISNTVRPRMVVDVNENELLSAALKRGYRLFEKLESAVAL